MVCFSEAVMSKVKSKARIKLSLMIMGSVVLGCLATSIWARNHKNETSVIEQSQRRHEQWRKGEAGDVGRWSLMSSAVTGPEQKKD